MSVRNYFPEAFKDPNLDPQMIDALGQVFAEGQNKHYGTVPLVMESFKQHVLGDAVPQDALLLCANASTGIINLQSVSNRGMSTEELSEIARDLVEPLAQPIAMDLGNVVSKTVDHGYSALSGVITLGREETRTEYGALVVPNVYKYDIYDMINFDENHAQANMTREEVSTNISASLIHWAIQNSLQENN